MITTTKLSGQPFWPKEQGFDLNPDHCYGQSSKKSRKTIRRIKSPNPEVYFPAFDFRISPEKKEINLDQNLGIFQGGTNPKSEYKLLNFSGHWLMPWLFTKIQS